MLAHRNSGKFKKFQLNHIDIIPCLEWQKQPECQSSKVGNVHIPRVYEVLRVHQSSGSKDRGELFLYTMRTKNKIETPGAEKVTLEGDGLVVASDRLVKGRGNQSKGRKLWTGKNHRAWYWAGDLNEAQLAKYDAWASAGMNGRCPDFKGLKRVASTKTTYRTGNTIEGEKARLRENLIETYTSNDFGTRFVTLNQSGKYETNSPAVTVNRVNKWFESLTDKGLALVSGTAVLERAQDGTCHVHAIVKLPDKALCLGQDGLNRALLDGWQWCSDDQKQAKIPHDIRGLAYYLTPLEAPGMTSSEVAPDDYALSLALEAEVEAKRKLKATRGTTKQAEERAKREVKQAHRKKKGELLKGFKRGTKRVVSVGYHGKAITGKATPEIMQWLKKWGVYLFTTQTEITAVDDSTGEFLKVVQVIIKSRYRLKEKAPVAELVALLKGE